MNENLVMIQITNIVKIENCQVDYMFMKYDQDGVIYIQYSKI